MVRGPGTKRLQDPGVKGAAQDGQGFALNGVALGTGGVVELGDGARDQVRKFAYVGEVP